MYIVVYIKHNERERRDEERKLDRIYYIRGQCCPVKSNIILYTAAVHCLELMHVFSNDKYKNDVFYNQFQRLNKPYCNRKINCNC